MFYVSQYKISFGLFNPFESQVAYKRLQKVGSQKIVKKKNVKEKLFSYICLFNEKS